MPFNLSLKWLITVIFLLMVGLLVAGYTHLSGRYFILGMDNMIASNMEYAARYYIDEKLDGLVDIHGYVVSDAWELQSDDVKAAFAAAPDISAKLLKQIELSDEDGPPKHIQFAMRYDNQQDYIYISRNISREMITDLVHSNVVESRNTLLIIGVLTALVFIVIVLLVLWRVSRPLSALTHWTRSLSPEKLTEAAPDFIYPELNEMAGLIQESLRSVQQGLEREQRFLRHTSHELRTPISVIRNNIELLQRLQDTSDDVDPTKQKSIIERIDRSSLTMQYLTETLLWLSKESPEALPTSRIQLDMMIEDLVADMKYLLNDKEVTVDLEVEAQVAELPEIAVRIILGNLIRNAFQHTWEGKVVIKQAGLIVEITNDQPSAKTGTESQGFGLGLQLTEQLTHRMGWQYQITEDNKLHKVHLSFQQ